MVDSRKVKQILTSLGADLCGIASIDRFDDAPDGYHPLDVMPTCKSVISFGCRFPVGALKCNTATVYTRIRNTITPKMDMIALDFCIEMEKHAFGDNEEKQKWEISCHKCRDICPHNTGTENTF